MDNTTNVFAIVYGNLEDGFTFVGPFVDFDSAEKYADVDNPADAWIIINVLQSEYEDVKTDLAGSFLVLKGDPVEGFDHIGPFKTKKNAYDYAELCLMPDYYIVELTKP